MSCPICGSRTTCQKCKGEGVLFEWGEWSKDIKGVRERKEPKCPHCNGTGKCPNN
jgi:DnaJ-class molecular chaperone